MRKIFTSLFFAVSWAATGQIQQDVNKTTGSTVSSHINNIDSIRFNGSLTEMEIIFQNSAIESHTISDIDNVTFSGNLVGEIATLNCPGAFVSGTVIQGLAASSVFVFVGYSGGNGAPHNGQTVNSTGVLGLSAYTPSGTFSNGAGSLTYYITGTTTTSGAATFALDMGGISCNVVVNVQSNGPYTLGTVHCAGPTAVVDVTNPATGKTWMNRNLGASQVATSISNADAYGDLYQWGRGADGHQCRTSPTTYVLSSTDQPGHGDFITVVGEPNSWRNPPNLNLWQGVNGINNPCPFGYRVPTEAELNAERLSWSSNNVAGAMNSVLKLPPAGYRQANWAVLGFVGVYGYYWSTTLNTTYFQGLSITTNNSSIEPHKVASGLSVRCIKN